jgi:hypothetical protein
VRGLCNHSWTRQDAGAVQTVEAAARRCQDGARDVRSARPPRQRRGQDRQQGRLHPLMQHGSPTVSPSNTSPDLPCCGWRKLGEAQFSPGSTPPNRHPRNLRWLGSGPRRCVRPVTEAWCREGTSGQAPVSSGASNSRYTEPPGKCSASPWAPEVNLTPFPRRGAPLYIALPWSRIAPAFAFKNRVLDELHTPLGSQP